MIAMNAYIADEVYKTPQQRPKRIFGYEILEGINDARYVAYKNDEIKHIVLGIRGTVPTSLYDLGSDVLIAAGKEDRSIRFNQALKLYDSLRAQYPGYKVTSASHSLGASISQFIGRRRPDHFGVTFNAGHGWGSVGRQLPRGVHLRTGSDPVSFLGRRQTQTVEGLRPDLNAHTIKQFTPASELQ